ncbi:MAG: hypothetical protein JRD03_08210 [Deltaproteobacteria bacterium]|nr:hypothetical protein [Deltaproteobacteria bacterium]
MMIRTPRQKGASILKRALLVAFLAVAAISISCADRRNVRMESWKGHPIEELIEHWGAPSGTAQLKNGRTVYTWIAVYGSGRTYRSTFTASKDGIIESWSYHDASVPKEAGKL